MRTQGPEADPEGGSFAAVDDSDGFVRALFEDVLFGMGIVEIDDGGAIEFVRVNTSQARFLGLPAQEARGQKLSQRSSPEVVALWQSKCREAQETRKPVCFEFAGSPLHPGFYSTSVSHLGDSAAGRPRFGFVTMDITLRRKLEERLSSILENAPGFISTLDRDFKILSFNGPVPVADQLIGTNWLTWISPAHVDRVREVMQRVLETGEIGHYETPTYGGDAQVSAWYVSDVGPLRHNGEIMGLTVVSTNITERKRLETEARDALARAEANAVEVTRKNDLLEHEIAERRRAEEILRKHQEEIRALSTPLIEVWDGVLALPVIGSVNEGRAAHIMEKLLDAIVKSRIRVAILDLTGVEDVDTTTAGHLMRIARAAALIGSRCVLSGISPRIAQTMTAIGIGAESFTTFGTLKDALRYALTRSNQAERPPP
jgi:PAS domain S-box-containing protein